ncbi:mediator of RNA polymerase II transcription subunit 17 [Tripterygium wilfordii]|uniref:Mediator of RNA polymerase II transcription subunit 17 n=1 Tax=Tripterygium wilfordii TaxID=458696 RepID=A0A7J7D6I6_TRIWF|nr:mediator of RNA polymerase II transcription subunit 17 [Tripterygium wilfordii]KAF5741980.1 mediator of RNA polymerase II transcription subunit 17 [Tripterygium wilfordii]
MEENLLISLDKLPVKRLEAIEENGLERFPADVGYDEKRVSLIRRIDFAWAVEKESEEGEEKKKKKKQKKESASTPWPWQSMLENLQFAQQELSVIIDLINTVEANDAVTVASMTRPKPLPNEVLSDLAVSVATKLQCYRHLGKYFKQSAKALEQQVAREARFYGALIRLQQNWKVKRQRLAASVPSNEGFIFDLFDSSLYDSAAVLRPSNLSTIRVDHDPAGMLAINVPPNSCHRLHFGFLGIDLGSSLKESSKISWLHEKQLRETERESASEDECIKEAHSLLREAHQAIFYEQVFDMVNREAFNQSLGVNVTGIRENLLQLSIGTVASVFISLVPSRHGNQAVDSTHTQSLESGGLPVDSSDGVKSADAKHDTIIKKRGFPNRSSYEIYLQQIFHEHVLVRPREKPVSSGTRISSQLVKEASSLLGHFCMSLAHRIFSTKVLMELENVVLGIPYLHLVTHPTWHSRTSSWTICMKVPQSILHADSQHRITDPHSIKNAIKAEYHTKVIVSDDCISVKAEGAPNVVGLFKGSSENMCSTNKYDCDLADLPVIVLQQVASQVVLWLGEEALRVGIKANRDFLCLSFELEQGELLSLVAHVDPEDTQGCISWWLVMEDGFAEEQKLHMDTVDCQSEYRRFLGHLSLEVLHSTLIDLVSLCNGGTNCIGAGTSDISSRSI